MPSYYQNITRWVNQPIITRWEAIDAILRGVRTFSYGVLPWVVLTSSMMNLGRENARNDWRSLLLGVEENSNHTLMWLIFTPILFAAVELLRYYTDRPIKNLAASLTDHRVTGFVAEFIFWLIGERPQKHIVQQARAALVFGEPNQGTITRLQSFAERHQYLARAAAIDALADSRSVAALKQLGRSDQLSWLSKRYVHYRLWQLGQARVSGSHAIYWLASIVTFYSWLRYCNVFIQSWKPKVHPEVVPTFVLDQKAICEAQHKAWTYLVRAQDWVCSDFGDFQSVFYKNINNPVLAWRDMLSQQQSAVQLDRFFMRMQRHGGVVQVDLSQQNWPQWNISTWQYLDKVLLASSGPFELDLSNVDESSIEIQEAQAVASFLSSHAWSRVNLASIKFDSVLYQSVNTSALIQLNAQRTNMSCAALSYFQTAVSLTELNLNGVNITDCSGSLYHFPVGTLSLSQMPFSQEAWSQLRLPENISSVNLSNNHLAQYNLADLWPKLSTLTAIDLSQNALVDQQVIAGVSYANAWQSVNLAQNQLSANAVKVLASLANLQHLNLASNPIGDAGVVSLFSVNLFNQLTDLNLNSVGLSDRGLQVVSANWWQKNITMLSLANNDFFGVGCMRFMQGVSQSNLTRLDISGVSFGQSCLETLGQQVMMARQLTELNLSENVALTCGDFSGLSHQLGASYLLSLKLNHNLALGSCFWPAFLNIARNPNLQSLYLQGMSLVDSGLEESLPVLRNSSLEWIDLAENPLSDDFSSYFVQSLASAFNHSEQVGVANESSAFWLALQGVRPVTTLQGIGLSNTQLSEFSQRAWCQLAPQIFNDSDALDLGACRFWQDSPAIPAHFVLPEHQVHLVSFVSPLLITSAVVGLFLLLNLCFISLYRCRDKPRNLVVNDDAFVDPEEGSRRALNGRYRQL